VTGFRKRTRGATRTQTTFRKVALLAAVGSVNAPTAFASSVSSAVFSGSAGTGECWRHALRVHIDARDTDPGSGVAAGSVTSDQVISTETSSTGLVVNGSAKDMAGNTGTDSVTVKLDNTKPTIGGAVVTGTMGKNGWYVSPVKVHFTCADALSGLASCQDEVTLSNNGAAQSATGTAKDYADNVGTGSVSGISIDNENPTITKVSVANGFHSLGASPARTAMRRTASRAWTPAR
jgi:hypothetical protein